jgi:hypothetical protein
MFMAGVCFCVTVENLVEGSLFIFVFGAVMTALNISAGMDEYKESSE